MWITKIELNNFQKHEHFEADLTQKVNVIYGPSDCGKSCVIRALKWVMYGEPRGDVVRKVGTKKTSVKLTLDSGVAVERIKSASINAFVLHKDGQEYRYDAVGRGTPEEVQKALQVEAMPVDDKNNLFLNLSQQIGLPFLLGESGTYRMKAFNKLTGNDVLDSVSQSFNKDTLKVSREAKSKTEDIDSKTVDYDVLAEQLSVETDTVEEAEKVLKSIKTQENKYSEIADIKQKFWMLNDTLQVTENKLLDTTSLSETTLTELKNKVEQYLRIDALSAYLKANASNLMQTGLLLKEIPVLDTQKLEEKVQQYEIVLDCHKKYTQFVTNLDTVEDQLLEIEANIMESVAEYKALLKEQKTCPVCYQAITDKCLEELSL